MNLCTIKTKLGDRYILHQDAYENKDYWVGIKLEPSGFMQHTIRTCCPKKDGIVWTKFVLRIEDDKVTVGNGDGYHRCFDPETNQKSWTLLNIAGLRKYLDKELSYYANL